jgi:MFS family permease
MSEPASVVGPGALLKSPNFRRIWLVGGVGWMMRWLEVLAIGVYAFKVTGSPLAVSLVMAVRFAPVLLLSAFTGAIAEQVNRRHMLIAAMSVLSLTGALLSWLAYSGDITLWHIGAGAFVSGLYFTTEFPVRRTMLGEVAGPSGIAAAMSLDSLTSHVMRLIGPVLGGFILETVGLHGVYLTGAVLYGLGLLLALSVDYESGAARMRLAGVIENLREGLSYLRRSPRLLATYAVTVIANFFAFPYATMVPVIGREELHLDAMLIGSLQSAEGAGALIGAWMVAHYARAHLYSRIYTIGTAWFLCGIFLFTLANSYPIAMIVLFAGGFGFAGFAAMQSTITFSAAPAEMRSRVMGVLAVCIGVNPLGMLHVGFLAEWLGAALALQVIAVEGLLALLLAAACWPLLRR